LEQLASSHLFARLCEHYQSPLSRFDRDGDQGVSEKELADLRAAQPDLVVQVAFDMQDATRSRVEVLATSLSLGDPQPVLRDSSLTISTGGTLLELSGVQSRNLQATDQVSLGAVRDGFPLLPEMDVNEDGRLTIRELRQVTQRLASFDRDQDGRLARTELLPTVRVAFGLGPMVHRHLATVRSVHSVVPAPASSPPEWFIRMDRNQDGDLTSREFLGGKDQFTALDTDKDSLISAMEALAGENSFVSPDPRKAEKHHESN
jgi:Ca2+-binding EF-hand superfamily protein